MKKIFVVAIFAVASLFVANATAQTAKAEKVDKAVVEQMMNTRLEMLKNELKLTDAQYAAFEPVYREYRKALSRVTDKSSRVKKEDLTNENALKVVAARLSNTINTSLK